MSVSQGFTVLGLGLLVWSVVYSASGYLAEEPLRSHGKEAHQEASNEAQVRESMLGREVAAARVRLEESPDSADAQTELGYALLLHGVESGSGGELIEALKLFNQALEQNPNQRRALLGMASVSLRVGVVDKAAEYYQRYLDLEPDDVRALSDYALALQRLGRSDEASQALQRALALEPESTPVLMVSAVVAKGEGKLDESRRLANKALENSENAQSKASITRFLEELATSPENEGGERPSTNVDGTAVDEIVAHASTFFGNHEIVGPKLSSLRREGSVLVLEVKEFPVHHMPEVAKERFSSRILKEFQEFKPALAYVDILDNKTKARLMRISLE